MIDSQMKKSLEMCYSIIIATITNLKSNFNKFNLKWSCVNLLISRYDLNLKSKEAKYE
jgi:hypothetical protein